MIAIHQPTTGPNIDAPAKFLKNEKAGVA